MLLAAVLALSGILGGITAHAADNAYIQVGQARLKKTVIAFPEIRPSGSSAGALARQIHETVTNDLGFMDLFSFLGRPAFVENEAGAGIAPGSFRFSDWSSIHAEILVKSKLDVQANSMSLEGYVYDVNGAKQLL